MAGLADLPAGRDGPAKVVVGGLVDRAGGVGVGEWLTLQVVGVLPLRRGAADRGQVGFDEVAELVVGVGVGAGGYRFGVRPSDAVGLDVTPVSGPAYAARADAHWYPYAHEDGEWWPCAPCAPDPVAALTAVWDSRPSPGVA